MANTFKNSISGSIGTSGTVIYQTPLNTVSTVIGVSLSNTIPNNIGITVNITDSSENKTASLASNTLLTGHSSLILVGGEQKIVLEENDFLSVTSSIDNSVDVIISVLEIS